MEGIKTTDINLSIALVLMKGEDSLTMRLVIRSYSSRTQDVLIV